VQGETEKIVITLRVMRAFSVLPGAPRACMFFRDPTDVSRLNEVLLIPVTGSWCLSIDVPLYSELQGSVRATGLFFNYGDLLALTLIPRRWPCSAAS